MKKFGIITNRDKDEGLAVTGRLQELLRAAGAECFLAPGRRRGDGSPYTPTEELPADTDGLIVLGGDGTLLQAAHDVASRGIPLLGINLGTLGFLAETELSGMQEAVRRLVAGQFEIEDHMMLSVRRPAGPEAAGESLPDALNDLVITRSGFSRLIAVGVYINGELVNNYRGDGVIISTPTGSTGYNLSAGGPIVSPVSRLIVITPICPHSLNARSIVVSDEDVVSIRIRKSKKTQEEEAIATVDGSYAVNLRAEDCVEVCRAANMTKLIRLGGSFYQVLRLKLDGGTAGG
ncbi:MAG: NAD(+)/NADH kinase [Lachnospiraceae bacterium]|nr:NAD(+)/NADH kinase [Lachnospiraceae bacterium]